MRGHFGVHGAFLNSVWHKFCNWENPFAGGGDPTGVYMLRMQKKHLSKSGKMQQTTFVCPHIKHPLLPSQLLDEKRPTHCHCIDKVV